MAQSDSPLRVCCLGPAGDRRADVPRIAFGNDGAARDGAAGVVLVAEPEARATELLLAGAPKVYLGEAALKDGTLIERLAAKFGANRIGVYAAARRMEVSWAMETASNPDFRFMMPSRCEPCWEALDARGAGSGTELAWWLREMVQRGASSILLRADVRDDVDLNILATLVEQCGDRLWVGPLGDADPDLGAWVEISGARQLALPHALLERLPAAVAQ